VDRGVILTDDEGYHLAGCPVRNKIVVSPRGMETSVQ